MCVHLTAEIQRGTDQSQVPVDSCGKPCDPQQGPHLGEVRPRCQMESKRRILSILERVVSLVWEFDWDCILDHRKGKKLLMSVL